MGHGPGQTDIPSRLLSLTVSGAVRAMAGAEASGPKLAVPDMPKIHCKTARATRGLRRDLGCTLPLRGGS